MDTITLNLDAIQLTDDQFYELCQHNQDWRLERSPQGGLIIMPPIGGESGKQEAELITDVTIWNRQTGLGFVFSSSTIFRLPNGASRSPDVAWIERERYLALSQEERDKFPPITPDFVIELRSRTDSLTTLQQKMAEYLAVGVKLGWLINPQQQTVEIYRPNQGVELRNLPTALSGEDVLPGFALSLGQ